MKIRTIDLGERPVVLAPMEDVTDPAFRLLCKEFGADMVYTEFVSSDALIRSVDKTMMKLNISAAERPVAIQIYGKDTETMVEAARIVEQARPDILDLNFGCPVKRVAGKGAGAGMLQNIPKMLEITRAVVNAVQIPVTVKTRLGWDENHKVIVELAEQLQDCGIEALTIHGRTRSQMYTGEADWTLIGEVKNNPRMRIPIIGNGDITTPQRAKECFDRYGVDAIMIGRASFGRPWIFKEVKHYLETGEELPPLSFRWKLDVLRREIQDSINLLDERRGILHVRRHLAASPLFKGIPNFRDTRIAMLRAETQEELYAILDRIGTILENQGEIILYQPDETIKLEVRLEDETVWLSINEMSQLFDRDISVIGKHIRNIFKEGELIKESVWAKFAYTASDGKVYQIDYYNLDVIISVGYRVKSKRGTQFRQWANKVLKEYLLNGYSINRRLLDLEHTVAEHSKKIDFFVRTSLPPVEGIFYNGQLFDAYKFATDLIRSAKESLLLIDNYVDESVLLMLSKRNERVKATIYTRKINAQLQLDLDKHNNQYPPIQIHVYKESHDRFLIIDGMKVYHIGASLKDLGKKMFAFSKLNIPASTITNLL